MNIKPCPKCGSENTKINMVILDASFYQENYLKTYSVECNACSFISPMSVSEDCSIIYWNMLSDYSNGDKLSLTDEKKPRYFFAATCENCGSSEYEDQVPGQEKFLICKSCGKTQIGEELQGTNSKEADEEQYRKKLEFEIRKHLYKESRNLGISSEQLCRMSGKELKELRDKKPLKPVNEACIGRKILWSDDDNDYSSSGILLMIKDKDFLTESLGYQKYIVTDYNINKHTNGPWFTANYAKRCPDVEYGDE